jgi:hypothetical protein
MTPLRWKWSANTLGSLKPGDPQRWLSIVPCPPSPLGHVGMARVDRAARVAKGQRGAAIDVPPANGSPFHPTTHALSAATISKMPLKPPRSSPTDSTGVAIPNAKTLTEYDAVALELVREHPWLAESGGHIPERWGCSGLGLAVPWHPPHAGKAGLAGHCAASLDFLRKGRVLMVTRIDRLARSIGDWQDIVRTVKSAWRGSQGHRTIDTGTAARKCFLDMNLRRERQLEGIARASVLRRSMRPRCARHVG